MTKTKVAPFYLGHGVFVLYIIKKTASNLFSVV